MAEPINTGLIPNEWESEVNIFITLLIFLLPNALKLFWHIGHFFFKRVKVTAYIDENNFVAVCVRSLTDKTLTVSRVDIVCDENIWVFMLRKLFPFRFAYRLKILNWDNRVRGRFTLADNEEKMIFGNYYPGPSKIYVRSIIGGDFILTKIKVSKHPLVDMDEDKVQGL